jgi:phage-related protein
VNPQQQPGGSVPRPIRRIWRWYAEPGSARKVARDEMGDLREDGEAALAEAIKRFRIGDERPGEIEKLTDCQGLWAVRARVGRDQFRAVFFYDTDIICVCVTAVNKNQRKLPPVDRKRALDRMKRWQQEGRRRDASA